MLIGDIGNMHFSRYDAIMQGYDEEHIKSIPNWETLNDSHCPAFMLNAMVARGEIRLEIDDVTNDLVIYGKTVNWNSKTHTYDESTMMFAKISPDGILTMRISPNEGNQYVDSTYISAIKQILRAHYDLDIEMWWEYGYNRMTIKRADDEHDWRYRNLKLVEKALKGTKVYRFPKNATAFRYDLYNMNEVNGTLYYMNDDLIKKEKGKGKRGGKGGCLLVDEW